jgi:hypothetical protein
MQSALAPLAPVTTTAVKIRRGELVPAELVKMGRTLLVGLRTLMAARKRH